MIRTFTEPDHQTNPAKFSFAKPRSECQSNHVDFSIRYNRRREFQKDMIQEFGDLDDIQEPGVLSPWAFHCPDTAMLQVHHVITSHNTETNLSHDMATGYIPVLSSSTPQPLPCSVRRISPVPRGALLFSPSNGSMGRSPSPALLSLRSRPLFSDR
jgi:hypothetical protein